MNTLILYENKLMVKREKKMLTKKASIHWWKCCYKCWMCFVIPLDAFCFTCFYFLLCTRMGWCVSWFNSRFTLRLTSINTFKWIIELYIYKNYGLDNVYESIKDVFNTAVLTLYSANIICHNEWIVNLLCLRIFIFIFYL